LQAALTAAGLGAFAAPVQLHAAAAKGTHGNWMATVHGNGGLHLARMDEYHSATGTVETTAAQPARGAVVVHIYVAGCSTSAGKSCRISLELTALAKKEQARRCPLL